MTPDRFTVSEHFSYDMIGTWYYEAWRNPHRTKESKERMSDAIVDTIEPLNFCLYPFPDYEFNAQEFAQR